MPRMAGARAAPLFCLGGCGVSFDGNLRRWRRGRERAGGSLPLPLIEQGAQAVILFGEAINLALLGETTLASIDAIITAFRGLVHEPFSALLAQYC